MQFLYPIGLLALAGLIIPLIIHLWNVKQGKTLKIGSISLLGESSRASSKSFRINDWLLLVLRCLLLILIAFIIASPFLEKNLSGKNKGWILVEKSKFQQAFKNNRKMMDSLTKLGYEIHDFNTGFAALSLKDTSNTVTTSVNSLNYTVLLKQLNNTVPSGNAVYLFAEHRLNKIGNELPRIAYQLHWKPLNEVDTLSSWIMDYAGKKYEAKSNPFNTVYSAINANEATPIKIAVYESAGSNDKTYLLAALKAIGTFSGRRIEINPEGKVNIGFWLADEPVAKDFQSSIEPAGTLFRYEKGKVITEPSFINIDGKNIALNKRVEAQKSLEKTWTDGFGNPILATEKTNNLTVFHFYSRFNPQWSQLVWDETFVKALMPIVIGKEKTADFGFENNPADQRRLAVNQKETIKINKATSAIKTSQHEPIDKVFWLIAFIILVIERILSFRKRTVIYAKN